MKEAASRQAGKCERALARNEQSATIGFHGVNVNLV